MKRKTAEDYFEDWVHMRPKSAWAICPECGADYYQPDSGRMCYPCKCVDGLRWQLRSAEKCQAERREKYGHRIPADPVEAEG